MIVLIFIYWQRVSYHHPLEEGLGRTVATSSSFISVVSYHHPLEEGLGHFLDLT